MTPARSLVLALLCAALPLLPSGLDAQILYPADSLERWFGSAELEIGNQRGARFEEDRTQRTVIHVSPGQSMLVKWAQAPRGGEEFNNVPRYEAGAYEFQKLFLEEGEYVVPPTVLRAFSLDWYRENVDPDAEPTFEEVRSVLVAIQYWLSNVETFEDVDGERFETDDAYARHVANFNVLTHLIDHKDANFGNFLVSRRAENPRVFSVDNGVAFSSRRSDRGSWWQDLRVDRVPRATVERLRRVDRADLGRTLAVLAQYEVRDDVLEPVAPGPPLDADGIRREDGVIQLGLTPGEIDAVEERLEEFLDEVDEGEIELF